MNGAQTEEVKVIKDGCKAIDTAVAGEDTESSMSRKVFTLPLSSLADAGNSLHTLY